jgi:predicted ATPase
VAEIVMECSSSAYLTDTELSRFRWIPAIYDRQSHGSHAFLYSQDPQVVGLSRVAEVLWSLGYPVQALLRSHEALDLAKELKHSHSLAYVLFYAAMLHFFRREWTKVQEQAEALITLSGEQGFPYRLAQGRLLQGWALAEQGCGETAIEQMRLSLAAVQATGAGVYGPYYLALLAEVYGTIGQPEEGLPALAEALTAVDKTGERFYEAELHRLKGELLLTLSENNTREVHTCFHRALALAQDQQAKSLELRAATSLARLWQAEGKRQAASDLLVPVYEWFTEGFDTAGLIDANALLQALEA